MGLYLVISLCLCMVTSALGKPSGPQVQPAEHRAGPIRLPFYGGASDRVLEFTENADGTYDTRIKEKQSLQKENLQEFQQQEQNSFEFNLKTIQDSASELVRLQDSVKLTGKMTAKQQAQYTAALERLGNSALRLANVSKDDKNDLRQLFENKNGTANKTTTHTKKDNVRKESFPGFKAKPSKEEEKEEEEVTEENVGEAEEGTGSGGSGGSNDDSIAITPPDKDSSVAEAKPVGLAIAGDGGVASSKPVATAVVGPGGLAVARPVATAIAGVKPSEIGSLGIPVPIKKSGLRASTKLADGKYGFIQSDDSGVGLLVGPNFDLQARFTSRIDDDAGEGQHDEIMAEPEDESENEKPRLEVEEEPRMVNEEFINAIMPRLGLPKYSGYPNVPQYPMVNVPYYNMMPHQILPAEYARRAFAPAGPQQYPQDRSIDEGQDYNRPYMPRPYFVYL